MNYDFLYNLIELGGASFFVDLTSSFYRLDFKSYGVVIEAIDIETSIGVCEEVFKSGYLPVIPLDNDSLKEALFYIDKNNIKFGCIFITNSIIISKYKYCYLKENTNLFNLAISCSLAKNYKTPVIVHL